MRALLFTFLTFFGVQTSALGQKGELSLLITGATNSEIDEIQSIGYKNTFSQTAQIADEVDRVKNELLLLGYFDIAANPITTINNTEYTQQFMLGNRYETVLIYVSSNEKLRSYSERSGYRVENDTVRVETIFAKAYLEKLTSLASQDGEPFTTFTLSDINKVDATTLSAKLESTSYSKRKIDDIIIRGYENFPSSFLKHYAGIKRTKIFDKTRIIKRNEALNNLPFTTSTKEPEALFTSDSTTLYLYLKKTNANIFDGFLGFRNNEAGKVQLNGFLNLSLINNLDYGEALTLKYRNDGNDQSQLKISTTLPYLLKSPFSLESQLSLFRRDSTFSESDFIVRGKYQLVRNLNTTIGYRIKTSSILQETNLANTTLENYTQRLVTSSINYTRFSNSLFSPIKQSYEISVSTGKRTSLTSNQQTELRSTLLQTIRLNNKNTIFLKNTTDYLRSPNYLDNELFRFGGIESIRGFNENSLSANFVSVVNTEYRYALNKALQIKGIFDAAYFENENSDTDDTLVAIGLGSSILTKAGLLTIEFINGKFSEENFMFSNTKLNITLFIGF